METNIPTMSKSLEHMTDETRVQFLNLTVGNMLQLTHRRSLTLYANCGVFLIAECAEVG